MKRHFLQAYSFPRKACLLVCVALVILPLDRIHAQISEKTDSIRSSNLPEVQVVSKSMLTSKTVLSAEASSGPASVTLVGRDYIAKQAVLTYGDLLRPLAGVNVSNYQLGGVGYGIQMRGYTVTEHARDVLFLIDGVPQNQGSSIEANGYVDLNPLIPEIIRRLEVIRGPFSPLYGDHALGGIISFETEDKLTSSLTVSGGTFGTGRVLGNLGFGRSDKTGFVSLEASRTDGYRDNSRENRLNGVAKYTFPFLKGMASVRAQIYNSDFGSAGYLVQTDVALGKTRRTQAVSSTDGGLTRQQNMVFSYKGTDSSKYTSATWYVQHHDFARIRTGTIGGPQRQDRDNRIWYGGDLRRTVITSVGRLPVLYLIGVSFRGDDIDNTRFATMNRRKTAQNQDRNVQTYTPSVYAQLQLRLTQQLKFTAGARYDELLYNLQTGPSEASVPNRKSHPHTGVFSPKAGLAYQLSHRVNLFANVARGFKAPSGYEENLFNPSLSASRLTSYELGIGGDADNGRLHGLLSGYISKQTGEIQSDPLGNLINFGNTRRSGIEAEGRAVLSEKGGLALFGNYTHVVAKIRNGGAGNIYVTNTPDYAATLGFDCNFGTSTTTANRLVLSVYDQLTGRKNLNASGSIRSNAFQRFSGKLIYSRKSRVDFKMYVEGSFYPGDGALNEVSFLSVGNVLTSLQPRATFSGGIKLQL